MQSNKNFSFKIFFLMLNLIFVEFFAINFSHAVEGINNVENSSIYNDELTCTLERVVKALKGPMGKAIASIAIIALGIGLFMGKLSWGLAVATAMGIAMIFGADSIVDWLSGGQFKHDQIRCIGV